MGTKEAVDLLSIDAAAVGAAASNALEQTIKDLPDDKLFETVAAIEDELKKAMAALAKKRPGEQLTCTKGPITCFEGTPIDCGAVRAPSGLWLCLPLAHCRHGTLAGCGRCHHRVHTSNADGCT